MNAGKARFPIAAVAMRIAVLAALLGALLLGGCAAPRKAARPGAPPADPLTIRLPAGTPLKIEQTPPPAVSEQSIAPEEVREGRERSLKLFQVDLGRIPTEAEARQWPPVPLGPEPEWEN